MSGFFDDTFKKKFSATYGTEKIPYSQLEMDFNRLIEYDIEFFNVLRNLFVTSITMGNSFLAFVNQIEEYTPFMELCRSFRMRYSDEIFHSFFFTIILYLSVAKDLVGINAFVSFDNEEEALNEEPIEIEEDLKELLKDLANSFEKISKILQKVVYKI